MSWPVKYEALRRFRSQQWDHQPTLARSQRAVRSIERCIDVVIGRYPGHLWTDGLPQRTS